LLGALLPNQAGDRFDAARPGHLVEVDGRLDGALLMSVPLEEVPVGQQVRFGKPVPQQRDGQLRSAGIAAGNPGLHPLLKGG